MVEGIPQNFNQLLGLGKAAAPGEAKKSQGLEGESPGKLGKTASKTTNWVNSIFGNKNRGESTIVMGSSKNLYSNNLNKDLNKAQENLSKIPQAIKQQGKGFFAKVPPSRSKKLRSMDSTDAKKHDAWINPGQDDRSRELNELFKKSELQSPKQEVKETKINKGEDKESRELNELFKNPVTHDLDDAKLAKELDQEIEKPKAEVKKNKNEAFKASLTQRMRQTERNVNKLPLLFRKEVSKDDAPGLIAKTISTFYTAAEQGIDFDKPLNSLMKSENFDKAIAHLEPSKQREIREALSELKFFS